VPDDVAGSRDGNHRPQIPARDSLRDHRRIVEVGDDVATAVTALEEPRERRRIGRRKPADRDVLGVHPASDDYIASATRL
jgi:hypothetical protein